MTAEDLGRRYRDYIACLNERDWSNFGRFVHDDVVHNGRRIGLAGYVAMLAADVRTIPDLHYDIRMLVVDPPVVASRLWFACTPAGSFLGLDTSGRRLSFAENVFYDFRDGKITEVWSIIDKAAIEAQLRDG